MATTSTLQPDNFRASFNSVTSSSSSNPVHSRAICYAPEQELDALCKHNLRFYNPWAFLLMFTSKQLPICKQMSSSRRKSSSETDQLKRKGLCCLSHTDSLVWINELPGCHLKPCWGVIKAAFSAYHGLCSVAPSKHQGRAHLKLLYVLSNTVKKLGGQNVNFLFWLHLKHFLKLKYRESYIWLPWAVQGLL